MPEDVDIDTFCEKIRCGEFYFESEKYYVEFDDMGRYFGGWKVRYKDPHDIIYFLNCIFQGCHDLIIFEEYEYAEKILVSVCKLEFLAVEGQASDDFNSHVSPFNMEDDSPLSIADVYAKNILKVDRKQVSRDLVYAFYMTHKKRDSRELAKGLIELLMLPICEKSLPHDVLPPDVLDSGEKNKLSDEMILIFEEEILQNDKVLKEKFPEIWSKEKYRLEKWLERRRNMLEDLKSVSIKEEKEGAEESGISILGSSWAQIQEVIKSLSFQAYIDDQPEIDEIWDICAALVKYLKKHQESRKIRKRVLQDIIENEYYDYYGCYDPMEELVEALCNAEDEYVEHEDWAVDGE